MVNGGTAERPNPRHCLNTKTLKKDSRKGIDFIFFAFKTVIHSGCCNCVIDTPVNVNVDREYSCAYFT